MPNGNVKAGPPAAHASSRLPSLDLLKGFEAAARRLSFTLAGEELHLTQSAVSRQIKELEGQLGVALFERRHRALALTEAGRVLLPAAVQVLGAMRAATERLRELSGARRLSVATTAGFASLWLIPRLAGFARAHPEVDVRIAAEPRMQDLERDGVDVSIRYCPPALAGANAERLRGERVFPVCSPKLLRDAQRPLAQPQDLRHHVLLHVDDPDARWPWLNWRVWLEVVGQADLRPAGNLRFSGYEHVIPAAIAGHGVALGRSPLVDEALASGRLAVPFRRDANSERAYWIVVSRLAAGRSEVSDFVSWLKRESAKDEAANDTAAAAATPAKARRSAKS
jgi:LysR family transcriptional regulator, glycine cleavage system transcriptional activator